MPEIGKGRITPGSGDVSYNKKTATTAAVPTTAASTATAPYDVTELRSRLIAAEEKLTSLVFNISEFSRAIAGFESLITTDTVESISLENLLSSFPVLNTEVGSVSEQLGMLQSNITTLQSHVTELQNPPETPDEPISRDLATLNVFFDALTDRVVTLEAASAQAASQLDILVSDLADSLTEIASKASQTGLDAVAQSVVTKANKQTKITSGGLITGGGDLSQDRSLLVQKATAAEVEAGVIDHKAVTPLSLIGILNSIRNIEDPIGIGTSNVLNTRLWIPGTQGSQGKFTELKTGATAQNFVTLKVGPKGTVEPIWSAKTLTAAASTVDDINGGFEYKVSHCDEDYNPKHAYRFTTWLKQDDSDGAMFFECGADVSYLNNGTVTDPFFLKEFDLPQNNKWYLVVGMIYGHTYTGASEQLSGVYDPLTGAKVLDGMDFKSKANATCQKLRIYRMNATANNSLREFARPRVDIVTGEEPTIPMLFGIASDLSKVERSTTISTDGLATGGGDLTTNRTISVAKASQDDVKAGTDDTKAVTPKALKGLPKATPAQVQDGTSNDLFVTPASLQGISLGGGSGGVVDKATAEDVAAGTSETKAVTPKSLSGLKKATALDVSSLSNDTLLVTPASLQGLPQPAKATKQQTNDRLSNSVYVTPASLQDFTNYELASIQDVTAGISTAKLVTPASLAGFAIPGAKGNTRNGAAIQSPVVASNGDAVDHVLNTDGSADISFEWTWGGVNASIDGWEVIVYVSTSATAYAFGSDPANEFVITLPPQSRSAFLYGVAANKYYTFGVRADRTVDSDISSTGHIRSSLVKPSLTAENPYRPSANVAFNGNITGTINGIDAATLTNAAQNFNTRNDRLAAPIAAPVVNGTGQAIDHVLNNDSSCNLSFEWSWTGVENDIDGFYVIYRISPASGVYPPPYNFDDPSSEIVIPVPADKRAVFLLGMPADNFYSFAVLAYRNVDPDVSPSGVVRSTLTKCTLASETPYRPTANLAYIGELSGTIDGEGQPYIADAARNFNKRNDRLATIPASPIIASNGTAIDHTVNTDSSVNLSFEWSWVGDEDTIDGFIVYRHVSASSAVHSFSTATSELAQYVPANQRAFIALSVSADKFYTFGVRAFRVVDPDVAPAGFLQSPIITSSAAGENPYQPMTQVAFAGDITGTINGIQVADVLASVSAAYSASTALANRLNEYGADGVITSFERKLLTQDINNANVERASLRLTADHFSITTEKDAEDNAWNALLGFLTAMVPPYLDRSADSTPINRTTFNNIFVAWKNAYQNLGNAISIAAGKTADWNGVTGEGKPDDNATANPQTKMEFFPTGFQKISGVDGNWDASVRSTTGYTTDFTLRFKVDRDPGKSREMIIGLNSNPEVTAGFSNFNFGFHFYQEDRVRPAIWNGSTPSYITVEQTFSYESVFEITRTGNSVSFYLDGTFLGSATTPNGTALFVDSSLRNYGRLVYFLTVFGPGIVKQPGYVSINCGHDEAVEGQSNFDGQRSWTLIQGQWTLTGSDDTVVNGPYYPGRFIKLDPALAWTGSVYSINDTGQPRFFPIGSRLYFRVPNTDGAENDTWGQFMIGWNFDPMGSESFSDIDAAAYLKADNLIAKFQDGLDTGQTAAILTEEWLYMDIGVTDVFLRHASNDAIIFTYTGKGGKDLAVDSSFYGNKASVDGVTVVRPNGKAVPVRYKIKEAPGAGKMSIIQQGVGEGTTWIDTGKTRLLTGGLWPLTSTSTEVTLHDSAPTLSDVGKQVGDVWYYSDEANGIFRQFVWDGTVWNDVSGNFATYRQNSDPSVANTVVDGDTWINPDTDRIFQRISGAWVLIATIGAPAGTNIAGVAAETIRDNAANGLALANDIVNDSILSRDEKRLLVIEWNRIQAEYTNLYAQAGNLSITVERTALNTAYQALNTYLNTTLSQTGAVWSDTTVNTPIVPATYRQKFSDYYVAISSLVSRMSEVERSTALWNGVSGTGRPDDYATRNEYRGVWTGNFPYAKGDLVTYNGSGYTCVTAHTSSNGAPPPNVNFVILAKRGADSVSGLLTNEAHLVAADADGVVSSYAGANGRFVVYLAAAEVTTGVTYSVLSSSGVTIAINSTGTYTVSAMSADLGIATLRAAFNPGDGVIFIDKIFTINKSRAGRYAKSLILTSSRQTIVYGSDGNVVAGQDTTFTANLQLITANVSWTATTLDGTPITVSSLLTISGTQNITAVMTTSAFNTLRGSTGGVIVTASVTDGITITDTINIVKLQDGNAGAAGQTAKVVTLTGTGQIFNFDNATTLSANSVTDILLTASLQNAGSSVVWTATDRTGTVALTGYTQSATTLTITSANFGTTRPWLRIRATSATDSASYDDYTIYKTVNGQNALQGVLTNDSHAIPTDSAGANGNYSQANGLFKVYFGGADVTAACAFSSTGSTNVTGQINAATNSSFTGPKGAYRVTDLSADSGSFGLLATYDVGGTTFATSGTFTLARAKSGVQGADGYTSQVVTVAANNQIFSFDNASTFSATAPASIDLTASLQNTSGQGVIWTAVDSVGSVATTSWIKTPTAINLTQANFGTTRQWLTVRATSASSIAYPLLPKTFDPKGFTNGDAYYVDLSAQPDTTYLTKVSNGYILDGSHSITSKIYIPVIPGHRYVVYLDYEPSAGTVATSSGFGGRLFINYRDSAKAYINQGTLTFDSSTGKQTTFDFIPAANVYFANISLALDIDNYNPAVKAILKSLTVTDYADLSSTSAIYDDYTIYKTVNGLNSLTGVLTNETHAVATDSFGANGVFTAANGLFKIYYGGTDVTANATLTAGAATGCNAQLNTATNSAFTGAKGAYRVTAMTSDQASFAMSATYTVGGTTFTTSKVFSLTKAKSGLSPINVILSNEAHNVPTAADGSGGIYTGANGVITVYSGSTDVTSAATFGTATGVGCTGTVNTAVNTPVNNQPMGYYQVTALSADTASLAIPVTYAGNTTTKVFSLSKSRTGITGAAAALISIAASASVFAYDGSGTIRANQSITFTPTVQNSTSAVTWTLRDKAGTQIATGNAAAIVSATSSFTAQGNVLTMTGAQYNTFYGASPSTRDIFSLEAAITEAGVTISDKVSVVRISDGAQGTQGSTGSAGVAGVQGPAGAGTFTLLPKAGITVITTPNSAQNNAAGNGGVRTRESYTSGAAMSFTTTAGMIHYMGLAADPVTTQPTQFNFCILVDSRDNSVNVNEMGTYLPGLSTFAAGDSFSIRYDNTKVVYSKNGVPFRTNTSVTPDLTLYLNSLMASQAAVTNITFVPAGAAGATLYTWIAYAYNITGSSGFTTGDSSGHTHIGIANNKTTAVESTNPADYSWSLIKGTDGVPGTPGANGQTTYTWFAYSSSADGSQDFTNGNASSIHSYVGLAANKLTAVESTNYLDYTWSLMKGADGVGNYTIKVGNPNIIFNPTTASLSCAVDLGGWGNGAYSNQKFVGGASLTFKPINTYGLAERYMIGLNQDNDRTDGYEDIDHAFYFYTDNVSVFSFQIYESATPVGMNQVGNPNTRSWSSANRYSIRYDGTFVRYYETNGFGATTLLHISTSSGTSRAYGLDFAVSNKASVADISFVPSGSTGATGAQGSTGAAGAAGPQGQALYTWIAYANNITGTAGFTTGDNTGQTHIGIANNKTTAVESTNPADYSWSLIKGTDGVQGTPGANGQATYTWFAYASSPDGSVNFTNGNPNATHTYVGIAANKLTQTESTNYADYTWSLMKGADGGSVFTLVAQNSGTVIATPSSAYKIVNNQQWDSGFKSLESYQSGAMVSFRVPLGVSVMVGLNSDPDTDASYTSLDYAIYSENGNIRVYESGTFMADFGAHDNSDVFSVRYDNYNVFYAKNGSPFRIVGTTQGRRFYLDSSLATTAGGPVTNITFSAAGTAGAAGAPGATGPAGGTGPAGRNAIVFNQEAQPTANYQTGDTWYKPSTKTFYQFNGSAWVQLLGNIASYDAISANQIAVSSLGAISANVGDLYAGVIRSPDSSTYLALNSNIFRFNANEFQIHAPGYTIQPVFYFDGSTGSLGLRNVSVDGGYLKNVTISGAKIIGGAVTTFIALRNTSEFPGSGQGTTVPSGGGGTGTGTGGDGGYGCVALDSFMPSGERARYVEAGSELTLLSPDDSGSFIGTATGMQIITQPCYRVFTESGISLVASITTPITSRNGEIHKLQNAAGIEVPVEDNGDFRWEKITRMDFLGDMEVAKISADDGTYAAGEYKDRYIFTHNKQTDNNPIP